MIHSNSSAPILPMQCYKQPFVELYNEDCLKTLERIETGSVDLMLTDIPYGTTACEWDKLPNLAIMWLEWERILKPNGAWVFTCQQPVTSELVIFKYEIIWDKVLHSNPLIGNIQPLRIHENILVFYRQQPTYNPQKIKGRIRTKGKVHKSETKGETIIYANGNETGENNPTSIVTISNANKNGVFHPTQKPLDLFRYLISTYSNENDLVFDGYSGSGTTAAACLKEKRRFIGSELSKEYFDLSVKRLEQIRAKPELF